MLDTIRQSTWASREVSVEEVLVDTAALRMAAQPETYDVLVTTNLFGDVLSDCAAHWCGGMGMAASLNWGEEFAVAEPVHGSAPDIAGKGVANPLAAIFSAALLARYAWNMAETAVLIERAVSKAMQHDLTLKEGKITQGTSTDMIARAVLKHLN